MKAIDFVIHSTNAFAVHRCDDIEIDLVEVMLNEPNREAVLDRYDVVFTPGNSFGHMTGGFDLGVVSVFGREVQSKVLRMIFEKYNGMMPVGAAEVVEMGDKVVIYAPTMFVPTSQIDPLVPYMVMHQALRTYHAHCQSTGKSYDRALCPLFGAGTGGIAMGTALFQQGQAVVEHQATLTGRDIGCRHLFKDGVDRYNQLTRAR